MLKLKFWFSGAIILAFISLNIATAQAQEEGEPIVVDQVVAQVNNDIITLSMLKREMREAVEALKQQRGMTEQQATEEVRKRQPELIASLINEQLLLQKGKEIPQLEEHVEAEVNRRMLEVARENGIKTIEQLDEALRANGQDPAEIRRTLRKEIMKSAVLNREVDARIYFSLRDDEVKKYFETHRDKFRKPETITLSEIFLSTAGKSEQEVLAKAKEIVQKARAGADFGQLAQTYSERLSSREKKGKLGTFIASDITRPEVAQAIKNLKAGGVTDPIKTEDGFLILRVDERTPPGEATFDEDKVREAMTMERAAKEREDYLSSLRKEAYIAIADEYREAVLPLLKLDDKTAQKGAKAAK
jgi:parvulin-like peptidyl-prolyl isomerase